MGIIRLMASPAAAPLRNIPLTFPFFSSSPNRSLPNYLWCADIRQADSLQEAGDVIPAAGRPDEGVGLHGDVVGHQLGGLLAEGPAGVPHAVMVHPKPKSRHQKAQTRW